MIEDLTIRPYEPGDEEDVVALWSRAGLVVPANDPRRDIRTKRAFQPDLLLVARVEGRLAGTVMAGYEGHRGWINYLAVAPERRRAGIGRRLMAEAERRLGELGCPKINLLVRGTNREVVAFYERLGFSVEDRVALGKRLAAEGG